MKPAILLSRPDHCSVWLEAFQAACTNYRWCTLADIDCGRVCVDDIHYAVVWKHPHHDLQRYAKLKLIFSLGAGIDHLKSDPSLPEVPIVPLHDPLMSADMARYCLYWCLDFQYNFSQYRQQQQQLLWQEQFMREPLTVGVLGIGRIGKVIAEQIQQAGFSVIGCRRQDTQQLDSAALATFSYNNTTSFQQFLNQTQILISTLPLTPQTEHLINRQVFDQLPQQSHFINIGRGAVVNEEDLLRALNSTQLKSATIDVCEQEPLPRHHPFWKQANLHITPHISGLTNRQRAINIIGSNLKAAERGQTITPLVYPQQSY